MFFINIVLILIFRREVAGACEDLIREGKIRGWGLCEVSSEIIRRAHETCPLTAVQSEYHLMWRRPETAVLPLLKKLGVAFVPYSPLNRGFLSWHNHSEYKVFCRE